MVYENIKDVNINNYDVIFYDPPFDMWKDFQNLLNAKCRTKVCFTTFQHREKITDMLGTPKIEMIWCFPNGKWVSHRHPQHCHESILIYGETNEFYRGETNKAKKPTKLKSSNIGRWIGPDYLDTPRTQLQLRSYIETPRINSVCKRWIKPPKLIRPLVETTVRNNDNVLDCFGGGGGIYSILLDYCISVDTSEIDLECRNYLNTLNKPLFVQDILEECEKKFK